MKKILQKSTQTKFHPVTLNAGREHQNKQNVQRCLQALNIYNDL